MLIYKIFTGPQWAEMRDKGQTLGAPIDLADGFVHFSAADQVRETAKLYFAGQDDLWLIAAQTDKMVDLRWEESRGGAKFPHLFEPFSMDHVEAATRLPLGPDGHIFPDTLCG